MVKTLVLQLLVTFFALGLAASRSARAQETTSDKAVVVCGTDFGGTQEDAFEAASKRLNEKMAGKFKAGSIKQVSAPGTMIRKDGWMLYATACVSVSLN